MRRPLLAVSATVLLSTSPVAAQPAPKPPPTAQAEPTPRPSVFTAAAERTRIALSRVPAPRPEDVRSSEALVAALYDVISGPAGQARDWQRFRSLFFPGAPLVPVRRAKSGGTAPGIAPITPDDYVTWGTDYFQKHGFHEKETHRQVTGYGDLRTVLSAYETRESPEGPVMGRGVNSLQLVFDGQRWWVLHLAWTDETAAGSPVPREFSLPPGAHGAATPTPSK